MESAHMPPHVALVWELKPNGGLACDDKYSFQGVVVGLWRMDEYSFGGGGGEEVSLWWMSIPSREISQSDTSFSDLNFL